MLKTSFIKIILVDIVCISCLYKFLNSFFVFSKRTTSTISKMLPNNGILLDGVLRPTLVNNPLLLVPS